MSKRRFYQPSLRELTVTELAMLLHKSHCVARKEQRQFLAQLGGEGTPRELDYFLSIAHNNADAVREAARLDQDLDRTAHVGHDRVTASVCQAVNWFTHAAISGSFGPDDSQDARSDIFLKEPSVIARAVEIFLENLRVDEYGIVANHEEAEQRAAEFIGERCF
ncbi:MAG: hypothetical protein U0935_03470 [Pirellulales bacterium]